MAGIILVFLKESIRWVHAKGKTWASPSKNAIAGNASRRGLVFEKVALLSLRKTPEATSLFFHIWRCFQRVTNAWWGPTPRVSVVSKDQKPLDYG